MASIQIRNVPAGVHGTLKRRAAEAGMSLSEYLRVELERMAERPTTAELIERIRARGLVELDVGSAAAVREGREERERQIARR